MKLETQGWYATRDVTHQCSDCMWRFDEQRMSSCEYGQPQFPKAHSCPQHKVVDDE